MVRKLVRKALLLAVMWVTFGSGVSHALGLGEISVQSALNQNLDASIELMSPTEEEVRTLLVNLAPAEEFERQGIAFPYVLGSLRFRVHRKTGEPPVIRVLSNKPILEPYLQFLVDVETINGRFLREYTILLDPPGSPVASYQPATAPARQAAAPAPAPRRTASAPARAPAPAAAGTYGPVKPKETLWSIANKTRPDDGVTAQQMMLALVNANPEAFDGRNINSLKRGVTLRIPDRDTILALNKAEALREAKRQVAQSRPQKKAAPKVAKKAAPKPSPAKKSPPAPALAKNDAKGQDPRLAELEAELAKARQKQMELQQKLAAADQMKAPAAPAKPQAAAPQQAAKPQSKPQPKPQQVADSDVWQPVGEPTVPTVRSKPRNQQGEQNVQQQPQLAAAPAPVTTPDASAPDVSASQVAKQPVAPAQQPAATQQVATATPQVKPKPKPAVNRPKPRPLVLQPPKQKGFFDDIVDDTLADPTMTALAGMGAVGLLSGALLGARRRRRAGEEAGEFDEDEFELGDEAGDFGATQIMGAADGDPLAVADMHLANGRTGDAVQTLKQAMAENPDNEEIKLKMLEIFEKTGDKNGFDALTQQVHSQGAESQPRVWEHIKRIAQKVSPDNQLITVGAVAAGAAGVAAAAVATADETPDGGMDTMAMGAPADELPDMLDLSDLGLDDDSLAMPELATGDEDAGEVAGLGLDFDLDDIGDGGMAPAEEGAGDFDLGDLDLPGDTFDAPAEMDSGSNDDFDLSGLDLGSEISLEDAAAAAAPSLETPPLEDKPGLDAGDDLGLDFSADAFDTPAQEDAPGSTEDAGLNFDADDLGLDMGGLSLGDDTGGGAGDDKAQADTADDGLDFSDLDMGGLLDASDDQDEPALSDDGLLDFSADDSLAGLGGDEPSLADAAADEGLNLDFGADSTDTGSAEDALAGLDFSSDSLESLSQAAADDGALALETSDADGLDFGGDDDLGLDFGADDLDAAIEQEAAESAKSDDLDFGETVVIDGLEMDSGKDGDLDLGDLGGLGGDDDGEVETKLDLAKAYIDMGDPEGARDMLDEVLREGSEAQKTEAQSLIDGLV